MENELLVFSTAIYVHTHVFWSKSATPPPTTRTCPISAFGSSSLLSGILTFCLSREPPNRPFSDLSIS